MFPDRYGLTLSTASAVAADRYIEGVDRSLSLNEGARRCFEEALAVDAGFALAHAALALVALAEGRQEEAAAGSARAATLAAGCSPRERGHVAAVAAIVVGEAERAIAMIREHLAAFPREAVLLRHAGPLIAAGGRADWPAAVCDLYAGLRHSYGDDWWFLGMYGFILQECEQFEDARRLAERSLALYPRNAAGAHTLSHVLHETGDDAGVRHFLGGWVDGYAREAPLHCHLSWHLALAELAGGYVRDSLARYERDIAPALRARPLAALADAASLLWRHHLRGGTAYSLPWREVATAAAPIAALPGSAFADAHAALALAAAGEPGALAALTDSLRRLADGGHPTAGTVVLPLALGIGAFAIGDYDETIRRIAPVMGALVRLGGSNVQRAVFEETLLAAYLRAGRVDQAELLWRQRANQRSAEGSLPGAPPTRRPAVA